MNFGCRSSFSKGVAKERSEGRGRNRVCITMPFSRILRFLSLAH